MSLHRGHRPSSVHLTYICGHRRLLHSGVSEGGVPSKKLVLFPAWPCKDWAVHFKLHAPGPTVLEGMYDGAGTLSNFSVSPPERKADVVFAGCVHTVL